jgi:nicotinamidase-related amidase
MKDWLKIIPEEERRTYQSAGFVSSLEMGQRPCLIVVDVTYGFTGSEGLTLEQAVAEFPPACGPAAWEAMPRIARLIELFRSQGGPIVFTRSDLDAATFTGKATHSKRAGRPPARFNEFPPAIAPREGEWVLEKTKASGFFQTPLSIYLTKQGVDTAVVCGVSTSGCVRATAVDAFSHGFKTVVIDDCCFDRSHFAHCANLFDLQAKYAAVLSLHELEGVLAPAAASARRAAGQARG